MSDGWSDCAGGLEDEIANLRAKVRALLKDKARLDWLDKYCTRVADSERYPPRSVYWGKGTHRNVRQAIDRAMEAMEGKAMAEGGE